MNLVILNHLTAKLDLIFYLLEFLSRPRDSQLQVGKNYLDSIQIGCQIFGNLGDRRYTAVYVQTQQTLNICITFVQRRPNILQKLY